MAIFLLKNSRLQKKNYYTELFGLSRSGKSSLLREIGKIKEKRVYALKLNIFKKLFYLIKFTIKNPFKTVILFSKTNLNWIYLNELNFFEYIKIFLMRNSYLIHVLAKYEIINKKNCYVDEFIMQSIFMIIQKKSNKKEILSLLKTLPLSGKILLIEKSKKERYERINRTRYPAEQINKFFAVKWMDNMEFNYKILRKILFENYGPAILIKRLDQL